MLTIHKPRRGREALACFAFSEQKICIKCGVQCGHNNVLELPNIDTRPRLVFIRGLLLLVITNTFSLNINKSAVSCEEVTSFYTFFPSSLIHFTSPNYNNYNERRYTRVILAILLLWQLLKSRMVLEWVWRQCHVQKCFTIISLKLNY